VANPSITAQLDALVAQCNTATEALYLTAPTPATAHVYIQQWSVFTRHSRRCWAWIVGNCPEVEVRRFITRENLYEEEGQIETSHYEKLVRLGRRLGLERAAIDDATPLPSTRLALLAWECICRNYSWQEGLAAKVVLERVGFPDLRAVRKRVWQDALHLDDAEADFFTTHIEADEIHGSGAYALLERYVTPAETLAVLAAAETSLHAQALYANGIAAAMQAHGGTLRPPTPAPR
jgi:pyrroloquinoline quinone (PQQ) biosynthesis protein C